MSKEEYAEDIYAKIGELEYHGINITDEECERILNTYWNQRGYLVSIINRLIEYKDININQSIVDLLKNHKLENIEIKRLSDLTATMVNNDWESFENKYKNPILRVYQVRNPKHEIFSIYEHNNIDNETLEKAFMSYEYNWAIKNDKNEIVKQYATYNDFLKETFENNYDGIINKFLTRKNPRLRYF